MNIININDDLDHELSYMSPDERADRLRGERQWRDHIELMEQEKELPIITFLPYSNLRKLPIQIKATLFSIQKLIFIYSLSSFSLVRSCGNGIT